MLVQNDSTYTGEWFEGRMHGKGVLKQRTGEVIFVKRKIASLRSAGATYDGDWDMNQRQGRGKFTVLNGQYSYSGDWANDVPHGHGDLEDPRWGEMSRATKRLGVGTSMRTWCSIRAFAKCRLWRKELRWRGEGSSVN